MTAPPLNDILDDHNLALINARFKKAAEILRGFRPGPEPLPGAITGTLDISKEEQLEMYGLYKQAVQGDASSTCFLRPAPHDHGGRAKWDAWAANEGMSEIAAKDNYVKLIIDILNSFKHIRGVYEDLEDLMAVDPDYQIGQIGDEDFELDMYQTHPGSPISTLTDDDTFMSSEEYQAAVQAREKAEEEERDQESLLSERTVRLDARFSGLKKNSDVAGDGENFIPTQNHPSARRNRISSSSQRLRSSATSKFQTPASTFVASGASVPSSLTQAYPNDINTLSVDYSEGTHHDGYSQQHPPRYLPNVEDHHFMRAQARPSSLGVSGSDTTAVSVSPAPFLLPSTAVTKSKSVLPTRSRSLAGSQVVPEAVISPATHLSSRLSSLGSSATREEIEAALTAMQTEMAALNERLDIWKREQHDKEYRRRKSKWGFTSLLKLCLKHAAINLALFLLVFAYLYHRRAPMALNFLSQISPTLMQTYQRGRLAVGRGRDVVDRGRDAVKVVAERLQTKVARRE